MTAAIFVSLLLYVILILWIRSGIKKIQPLENTVGQTEGKGDFKASVIIPFRNEADNLKTVLESLSNQSMDFNSFQIILINDHSHDYSIEVIQNYISENPLLSVELLTLTGSQQGKKEAIHAGIQAAKYPIIVQTDADCQFHTQWLESLSEVFRGKTQGMAILPVFIVNSKKWISHFDRIEFSSLQAVGIGTAANGFPVLCSGANLAYFKKDFIKANENRSDQNIHSGDDVFLLQAFNMLKIPVYTALEFELVVRTLGSHSCKSFLNRRRRWAKKNLNITDPIYRLIGLIAIVANGALIGALFIEPLYFVVLLMCKIWVDGLLLYDFFQKSGEKFNLVLFVLFGSIYPFYLLYVSLSSIWQNSEWKGRLVEQ